MTRTEFIHILDTAGDVEFSCHGKNYTALCWWEEGGSIFVAEQVTEENAQIFADGAACVDGYIIDGKTLGEWLDEGEFKLLDIY